MTDSDDIQQQFLPPYTYVPGLTPHPQSDPRGHSPAGLDRAAGDPVERGTILFDRGYYWEAHEAWEAAWKLAGRRGPCADFVKGLIKLAACGVKCLEKNRAGAARHARRAAQLFHELAVSGWQPPPATQRFSIEHLLNLAQRFQQSPPLVDDQQRQLALQGGVPVLGTLPRGNPAAAGQ